MVISGSKDGSTLSSDPVQDLVPGSGLPPAPKQLPNRPHIESRLEHSSSGQTSGFEKIHGRAQKVRGKFTDTRRQEVQEIRKKGACIRCRMLRKTVCVLWDPVR